MKKQFTFIFIFAFLFLGTACVHDEDATFYPHSAYFNGNQKITLKYSGGTNGLRITMHVFPLEGGRKTYSVSYFVTGWFGENFTIKYSNTIPDGAIVKLEITQKGSDRGFVTVYHKDIF